MESTRSTFEGAPPAQVWQDFSSVPEDMRLAVVREYQVLDTPPERDLDDIATLAAELCGTPIALVNIVDRQRLFVKARAGTDRQEFSLAELGFCSEVVARGEVLVVPDASVDERFSASPAVASEPGARSYAGAPLVTTEGIALGTLCAIDVEPRPFSEHQLRALKTLARQVVNQFELRRRAAEVGRAREALERAVAVQDLFVATAAHDLRGPLTSIAGFAKMLEQSHEAMTPEQRRMCAVAIAEAGRRLNRMVANLAAVQEIRAGAARPDRRSLDLGALVQSVVSRLLESDELVPKLDEQAGQRVCVEVERPVVLSVDEAMVERITDNLVTNALQHGEGAVRVSLEGHPQGAVLSVEDQGHGVPDAMKSTIFQRYQQGDSSAPGGMGIGLFVVSELAALHGGRAWVEDGRDGGAAFRVYLPEAG